MGGSVKGPSGDPELVITTSDTLRKAFITTCVYCTKLYRLHLTFVGQRITMKFYYLTWRQVI